MDHGGGEKDSFEVVWDYLQELGENEPRPEDALRISPALREVHDRVKRVQRIAPRSGADLSEEVWGLIEAFGIAKRAPRAYPFRNAASFL